jgi:hypothetical protein
MPSNDESTPFSKTGHVISESIKQFLQDYVSMPFLDLREATQQARLWTMLRQRLDPLTARARIVPKRPRQPHAHEEVLTNRVQLELKIGNRERTDIIVFRADRLVSLTCDPWGPAGVLANVVSEDVEAAIEIKFAPSRKPECRQSFVDDVMKLHELQKRVRDIRCFFVLLDMSLSVTGAKSSEPPDESWRDTLRNQGFVQGISNSRPFVEAWDLQIGDPAVPLVEYWSKAGPDEGHRSGSDPNKIRRDAGRTPGGTP